jgi:hypothetical protein
MQTKRRSMRHKAAEWVIAFYVIGFPPFARTQAGLPERAPVTAVGCYTSTGRNRPVRFRLDSTPILRRGNPTGAWRVTPNLPEYADTLYGLPPEWRIAKDSITVVWSRGLSGLTLRLAPRGNSLAGTAVVWTDVIPPGGFPTERAAYARTPCTDRDR